MISTGRPLLKLKDKKPLAIGKRRLVFEHPSNPGWLIKVSKKSASPEKCRTLKELYQCISSRYAYMTSFTRELREYILSRYVDHGTLIDHLPTIIGFEDTDRGLGLVVNAFFDSAGRLAPTLSSLIQENQLTDNRKIKLEELFNKILDSDLVIGDLNPRNLVLIHHYTKGECFMLIDGL